MVVRSTLLNGTLPVAVNIRQINWPMEKIRKQLNFYQLQIQNGTEQSISDNSYDGTNTNTKLEGNQMPFNKKKCVLLSTGSFNPVHTGHVSTVHFTCQ